MSVRDALGIAHPRAQTDARIVSLVPSVTELVCDLGLAPNLVGRTGFCVHPKETVRAIAKVGGTKSVDLAKVRALQPSHAILNIDENEKPLAEALAAFVPHLVVTHPLAPLDNLALYRLIGGIFGREREAQALCAGFQTAHDALAAQEFTRRRVLYLIWKDPWMTVSRDTYISRTLALAGLDTLPQRSATRYPAFAMDADWVEEAELVLLSTEPYRFRSRHLDEFASLPGLRGKTLMLVDGEMTSWYGSRAIAGLAYLRELRRSIA